MTRSKLALLAALVLAAPASAQSFNVDFGLPGAGPSPTYGAAGLPGVWNSIEGAHTTPALGPQPSDYPLVDIHGNPTGVGMHQFGGTELILENDPSVSGDDAILLNDALVTHSIVLKSCLYFNGLEPGMYEVLMYTWNPNHPEVTNVSFIDTVPGQQFAGGAWTGQHAEGVTYTRFFVNVTSGFMGPHAGLPAGGNTSIGGALNGIQLRKLCAPVSYCVGAPNSTGFGASMSSSDNCSTGLAGFDIDCSSLPANESALFYFGDTQIQSAFGDGFRCVGGNTVRLWPPQVTSAAGTLQRTVDFGHAATGGMILAGSTWNFQCWYRDPAALGTGFNLSDGLSVTFD